MANKVKISPRGTGIIAVADKKNVNVLATDIILGNGVAEVVDLNGVIGLRPYTAFRLDSEIPIRNITVVAKLEIFKDDRAVWLAYDSKPFKRGVLFSPGLDYNITPIKRLNGEWKLTASVALLPDAKIPIRNLEQFFDSIAFSFVDVLRWEITDLRLDLKPTGERKTKAKTTQSGVTISMDDI